MVLRNARELGRSIRQSQTQTATQIADGIPAVAGKRRADNTVTLHGDSANNDLLPFPLIYARLHGNDFDVREVLATEFGGEAGDEIKLRQRPDGKYVYAGLDDEKISARKGETASDSAVPLSKGSRPDSHRERSLVPGRLRLSTAGTLDITADLFSYEDDAGDPDVWDPEANDPLDLTANVPAAVGGVDQYRFVWITLNPVAGAPVLVANAGSAAGFYDEFGYTDISLTAGHIPLGVVLLKTGDSTLTADRFDNASGKRGWPGRLLLGKIGEVAAHLADTSAHGVFEATVQTTNNTTTTLYSLVIAEGQGVALKGFVLGVKSDESAGAGRALEVCVRRASGGNVTIIGSVQYSTLQEDSSGSPTIEVDVDTGTQTVRVRVTGITSEVWNWKVRGETMVVAA
jgi:hypothetical protein